jgi:hypothetical protein
MLHNSYVGTTQYPLNRKIQFRGNPPANCEKEQVSQEMAPPMEKHDLQKVHLNPTPEPFVPFESGPSYRPPPPTPIRHRPCLAVVAPVKEWGGWSACTLPCKGRLERNGWISSVSIVFARWIGDGRRDCKETSGEASKSEVFTRNPLVD